MDKLSMNKTMTTKEVAEALGCSERTVQRYAQTLNCGQPLSANKRGNKTLVFTEQEVTTMLNEMKKATSGSGTRNDLTTTSVVKSTETSNSVVARIAEFASNIEQTDLQAQLAMAKAGMKALDNALSILKAENSVLKSDKEQLQVALDASKSFASVKLMEKLNPNRKFDWRVLKNKSKELSCEIKKCIDQNYGEVNAYSKEVWEACYELDTAPWD